MESNYLRAYQAIKPNSNFGRTDEQIIDLMRKFHEEAKAEAAHSPNPQHEAAFLAALKVRAWKEAERWG